MTELLSVYAQNDTLYLLERRDEKIEVRAIKYEKPIHAAHNMPSSNNVTLPTDQVLLDQYSISTFCGLYDFEYHNGEPNGYLSYIRDTNLRKDVFLCYNSIVHVQDYEEKTPVDKAVNEIISEIRFNDHTVESFIEYANKKLGEAGIDLEKEVASMVFEEPVKDMINEIVSTTDHKEPITPFFKKLNDKLQKLENTEDIKTE